MILDTNAVSALLAGDTALEAVLAGHHRLHLPSIVIGEYRFGLAISGRREQLATLLDTLIDGSKVLPVDLGTTHHYAAVRAELRRAGTPIPENDIWIAALARQHSLPVVSRDTHFDAVARLMRRSW